MKLTSEKIILPFFILIASGIISLGFLFNPSTSWYIKVFYFILFFLLACILVLTLLFIKLKKSEIKYRESNRQAWALYKAAPDAVIIIDQNGKVVNWNAKAEKLFGWEAKEVVGNLLSDFIIPHRYREMHTKGMKHFLKTGEGTVLGKTIEISALKKNNDEFPVALSISPVLVNENQYLFVGFMRDISENKKNEEQLKHTNQFLDTILDNLPNMVFVKDANELRFIRFNIAGEKLLGYSRNDLIGKNDYDFFPKEQADFFTNKDRDVLAKGILLDIPEEPIQTKSGERWLHTKKIPVTDQNNAPLYLLGISEDITERKSQDDKIKNLNSELESNLQRIQVINNELESFTYSVSHDLRAPLRIIDGFADMLVSGYEKTLDAEEMRIIGIIRHNARKMGQLIDDLLHFSHMGRKELEIQQVDINKLVNSVIDEQRVLNKSLDIKIKTGNLAPSFADKNLLKQVWVNLISNAIKYSKQNENSLIEIGCNVSDSEIIYFVKDNGVGFDMQFADKLFGVFQRLHNVSQFEGTGVGLALAQRIILKHKGRIWAEAETDKGAVFYFSLPKENNFTP